MGLLSHRQREREHEEEKQEGSRDIEDGWWRKGNKNGVERAKNQTLKENKCAKKPAPGGWGGVYLELRKKKARKK